MSAGYSRGSVLILEAAAGFARRQWLENHLQEEARAGLRTFSVSADFDLGGPWAGVSDLFAALLPEIQAECPNLIERHAFELVHILPRLRRRLTIPNPSLTDISPPSERSRNYAADHAFRVVQGLIDMLDGWKSHSCPDAEWLIACDAYDFGGPMSRRFFTELLRRRGERLKIHLVLAVTQGAARHIRQSFPASLIVQTLCLDLPADSPIAGGPVAAAQKAAELEQEVGEDAIERQVRLPDLVRLWRAAGRADKLLQYKRAGLDTCTTLGLYEDALRYAENIFGLTASAPDEDPQRWSAIIKMLTCYAGLQNAKAGLELAEGEGMKAAERRPERRAWLFYMMAMFYARYSQPRDLAKGEEYLEQGLSAIQEARQPEEEFHLQSAINRNGLALVRSLQGRHQEAMELCQDALDSINAHVPAHKHHLQRSILVYNMAQVYFAKGDYEQALRYYTTVIGMDPNYSEYYNDRGNILLRLGRLEEARADYLKAAELGLPYFEVFTNLGQCYRRMGAMEEAIASYSRALDLEPAQALALVGRAKAREELGHMGPAIADYSSALAIAPEQWDAVASRGALYYQMGNLDAALADLDRAVKLKPNDPDLFQNRSIVLAELGRHSEAARDLQAALSFNPAAEDRQILQARLENEMKKAAEEELRRF